MNAISNLDGHKYICKIYIARNILKCTDFLYVFMILISSSAWACGVMPKEPSRLLPSWGRLSPRSLSFRCSSVRWKRDFHDLLWLCCSRELGLLWILVPSTCLCSAFGTRDFWIHAGLLDTVLQPTQIQLQPFPFGQVVLTCCRPRVSPPALSSGCLHTSFSRAHESCAPVCCLHSSSLCTSASAAHAGGSCARPTGAVLSTSTTLTFGARKFFVRKHCVVFLACAHPSAFTCINYFSSAC